MRKRVEQAGTRRSTTRPRRLRRVALLAAGAGVAWAVARARARRASGSGEAAGMREFDPAALARLEARMWRSYYDRRRLALFGQLIVLLREQFRLPPLRSLALAGLAARAAAVFQAGSSHADYQRALPLLERYYQVLRQATGMPFDDRRAAQLELAWWVAHRDLAGGEDSAELERLLADVAAEVYRVPAAGLALHARLRADAMLLRDRRAAAGTLSEEDWARVESLLRESWDSLHELVATDSV